MFSSETVMQELVHNEPDILLSGIPEINPQYCPDTPQILSLGREIPLSSGQIDNLYIDSNAIITFVECKRYSDSRLKREVYSQIINYASDMQNLLFNFSGSQLINEFYQIISGGQAVPYPSFSDVIDELSNEPILNGKHIQDWKEQFIQRLEHNIKVGAFRLIIACAPAPDNSFAYPAIRNLMQIMSFTESSKKNYDLILMDIRPEQAGYVSKIIWRSYTPLPQIPLIAQATRDTSAGIEKMLLRYSSLPISSQEQLDQFLTKLKSAGFYTVENTYGYSIYSSNSKKSLYTYIKINDNCWEIVRHQVRVEERLFDLLSQNDVDDVVGSEKYTLIPKKSGDGSDMFELIITPSMDSDLNFLLRCIHTLSPKA